MLAGCAGGPAEGMPPVVPPAAPAPPAEQVVYCAHSVERRGVEECPEPLTAEAASHRGATIVLRLVNGRVMSFETVNGLGELRERDSGVAVKQYRYEGDRVAEVAALSSARRLRYTEVRSPDQTRIDYVAPSGRPKLMWKLATAEVRTFDEQGFVRSRRYFDRLGNPTKNDVGVHELRYLRGEHGYWTQIDEFDDQGRPARNEQGFHRLVYEVGPHGAIVGERYFGVSGEPVIHAFGAHSYVAQLDAWGNRADLQCRGLNGEPVFHTKSGARWTARFDEHGNQIELAYFGVDGKPVDMRDGWAKRQAKFDGRGREVESRYTAAGGDPIKRSPLRKHRYDDRNRLVENLNFDWSGEPWKEGVASERVTYDDRDNKVHVRLLDAAGKLVTGTGKFAEYRVFYNDDDQPIEKLYLGPDGQPADSTAVSARVVYTYDDAGKLTKTDYFDPAGNPTWRMAARHLLVMYTGSKRASADLKRTKEEARLRAEEAKKKIAEGMPFEEAVKLYSDEPGAAARGGDLGTFGPGRMVHEFEKGALATPVGEVSAVVESPFGFHLIERTQ
jgi:YD repeat-containing protein